MDAALTDACERFLDQHNGECFLRDRRAAQIVADSLQHFDGQRYCLYAWCVMPNHVHVVLSCLAGFDMSSILHSLKGFTSKEINKLLGRSGTLWQAESYDRCIRDSVELQRTIDYVLGNPIAAGLDDWPFVAQLPRPHRRCAVVRRRESLPILHLTPETPAGRGRPAVAGGTPALRFALTSETRTTPS